MWSEGFEIRASEFCEKKWELIMTNKDAEVVHTKRDGHKRWKTEGDD